MKRLIKQSIINFNVYTHTHLPHSHFSENYQEQEEEEQEQEQESLILFSCKEQPESDHLLSSVSNCHSCNCIQWLTVFEV
jgi:hypothetical protein